MKITTWNVNGVRARLTHVIDFLREQRPDVLCLQETKVVDEGLPRELLEDEGYNIEHYGQKSYNGTAILARHRMENVVRGLPGDEPTAERRLIGCTIADFMLLDVYCPNGQAVGTERYHGKLKWYGRLRQMLDNDYPRSEKLVVLGDFNVTPDDRDVWDPEAWRGQILCSEPERAALRELMAWGLQDVTRRFHEEGGLFTYWDYQAGRSQKDHGLRIDLILTSTAATEACTGVTVHKDYRLKKGASDHCPVTAEFA